MCVYVLREFETGDTSDRETAYDHFTMAGALIHAQTHIMSYIHTRMRTCMDTYKRYKQTFKQTNTYRRQNITLNVCLSFLTFTNAHAHIQGYVHPRIHTTKYMYKHTCLQTHTRTNKQMVAQEQNLPLFLHQCPFLNTTNINIYAHLFE